MGAKKIPVDEKKRQIVLKGYKRKDIDSLGGYSVLKRNAEDHIDNELNNLKKHR